MIEIKSILHGVNENAMMVLFRRGKIKAEQQVPIKVRFHGVIVGDCIADILVENKIILELKYLAGSIIHLNLSDNSCQFVAN